MADIIEDLETKVDGDQTAGNEESTPKTFTQDEVNDLIKERLKRANKPKEDKPKTPEKNPTDEKISTLETKLLCYEKDIAKDSVQDALALAKSYVNDEVDLSKALDMVLEKYPSFGKQAKPTTTGVKSQGDGKKLDGVEAEFLKRNPKLKL
ncbi:MAG: hypothetical protein R3Y33_04530 [Clostridia bacterium]